MLGYYRFGGENTITQFIVNPKIFLYLAQNPDEQNFFIDKATEYYMNYAIRKHMMHKNDEAYEFKDKSIFTFIFNDVHNTIYVSYNPTNPLFKTSGDKWADSLQGEEIKGCAIKLTEPKTIIFLFYQCVYLPG